MPKADIDALKKNPGCVKLFADRVTLRKEAGELVGLCPFHSEKSGSFHVYQDSSATWLGKCFGCSWAGNVVQFLKDFDKVSMKEAIDTAEKSLTGPNWESMKMEVEATFKPASSEPKEYKTYTLAEYAKFEQALAGSQAAQNWLLDTRGVGFETAKHLHLGYRQRLGDSRDPKVQAVIDQGWIAYPGVQGETVITIKYRSIAAKVFSRQFGMATALFNTNTIDLFEPLYVVEGELDAAALEQAGFRAVSIPSASLKTLTPEMKDQIMTAPVRFLAGDNDGGVGNEAMERLWKDLGENTYLLKWPEGVKDANQAYLDTCGRDTAKFTDLVEELSSKAKEQPMPYVYSVADTLRTTNRLKLSDHPLRLHFPWKSVDEMANLLPGSVLVVTATNSGMGKTAWVNELCLWNARKHGEVCINYQCELNQDEISTMVAANVLRKDRNHLGHEDNLQAFRLIKGIPYYVGNNPSLTTSTEVLDLIEAAIRRLGATMAVLDHLHFICRGDDETQQQGLAMRRIKRMAQEYGTKFIVVGQPRKSNQQNKGKRVHLTDMKGSETIISDSDAAMFLHRDLVKNPDPANPPKDPYDPKTQVDLVKVRSKGEGGALAMLMFAGQYAAFSEIDYTHSEADQ